MPGHLYLSVRPERADLADTILDWFERTATADDFSVDVLDLESHLISALIARGYQRVGGGPFDLYAGIDLSHLPPRPILPRGFHQISMRDYDDVERRAASHRAAWHPSSMTVDQYRRVMATWPYRPELDRVIEIADGRLVANCTIWFDEGNGVGLLEPLGVDPGFRRLGLAKAVCLDALHALRDLGGTRAIVYPRGDDGYPFTKPLYLGMGFEPYARTISFTRRR